MRGRRDAPEDIDFIVVCCVRSDVGFVSSQRLMDMQVNKPGCCLMFELFGVNVVKRRLEEPPQEREHSETEATDSHRFSTKVPPARFPEKSA